VPKQPRFTYARAVQHVTVRRSTRARSTGEIPLALYKVPGAQGA